MEKLPIKQKWIQLIDYSSDWSSGYAKTAPIQGRFLGSSIVLLRGALSPIVWALDFIQHIGFLFLNLLGAPFSRSCYQDLKKQGVNSLLLLIILPALVLFSVTSTFSGLAGVVKDPTKKPSFLADGVELTMQKKGSLQETLPVSDVISTHPFQRVLARAKHRRRAKTTTVEAISRKNSETKKQNEELEKLRKNQLDCFAVIFLKI